MNITRLNQEVEKRMKRLAADGDKTKTWNEGRYKCELFEIPNRDGRGEVYWAQVYMEAQWTKTARYKSEAEAIRAVKKIIEDFEDMISGPG